MCHHEDVGGERSSACGGMPKGRNVWAAEMFIKRSSLCLESTARSDSHTL